MTYLDTKEIKKILSKYKIPCQKSADASSKQDAVKIAQKIGYSVVLKIESPDIIHKSDVGGIIVGINNKQELIAGFQSIISNVKKKKPKARINGILVQKMSKGYEIIVGMKRDPQFGPAIMFGLGGILVEVLKDVSFRITPVSRKMALEMIKEIKSYKILEGARGKEPANINAIADIIVKTSKMVDEHDEIQELDFNPVIADKKQAIVVDARIMIKYNS